MRNMSMVEMQEVNGGGVWLIAGCIVGASTLISACIAVYGWFCALFGKKAKRIR